MNLPTRDAVAKVHAEGVDLDDPRGAALAFAELADLAARLPLPGRGHTSERFAGLAQIASVDVTLGRLIEAHSDAIAILAELTRRDPVPGERWGVWAAEGPQSTVQAVETPVGFQLTGAKPWCSGATFCTHALVTAAVPEGRSLFAVELDTTATADAGNWQAIGLSGSGTATMHFRESAATTVGASGAYLTRPGFWFGAIGVAAIWWGAAAGIAAPLYEAAAKDRLNAHSLAHLGAVHAALTSTAALLREGAGAIDLRPDTVGEGLALTVRGAVETAATEVIDRVGRALGPGPLCADRAHARRVADLTVYLRQSHAERDLERVGQLSQAPTLDIDPNAS